MGCYQRLAPAAPATDHPRGFILNLRLNLCLPCLLTGVVVAMGAAGPARAQVTAPPKAELFPDPSKFAYGLYTEGALGAVTVLGPAGSHLSPGWALGLTAGYDLTHWLAIEGRGVGSTHTTEFPDAPQDGELLQLYHLLGALRFNVRYRYLIVSGDGTAGIVHTSTNVLASVGLNRRRTSLAYGGGLGVDYHTLSRHFAFGVHVGLQHIVGLAQSNALTTTAGLRYTF